MTYRILKAATVALFGLGSAQMAMAFAYSPGTVTAVNPGADSIAINGHTRSLASAMTEGDSFRVGERVLYKFDGYGSDPHLVAVIPARGLGMKVPFTPVKVTPMRLPSDLSGAAKARADGNLGARAMVSITRDAANPLLSGEAKQAAMMAHS